METTDEQIVIEIQKGNSDSFGVLMARYEPKLKRYGRKFLSRDEDIQDLVQDVFIKTYQNIQSFDAKRSFSPWIYRIAHNTFVNELRRTHKLLGRLDADAIFPTLAAKETADKFSFEEADKEMIENLLDRLSPKYREVVVLHYYEDLSYKEISEVLKLSVSTVGVRMTRARQKIKFMMEY